MSTARLSPVSSLTLGKRTFPKTPIFHLKMEITILLQYGKSPAYSKCSTNWASFLPKWILGSAQWKLPPTPPFHQEPVPHPPTSGAPLCRGEDETLHTQLSPCVRKGRQDSWQNCHGERRQEWASRHRSLKHAQLLISVCPGTNHFHLQALLPAHIAGITPASCAVVMLAK